MLKKRNNFSKNNTIPVYILYTRGILIPVEAIERVAAFLKKCNFLY